MQQQGQGPRCLPTAGPTVTSLTRERTLPCAASPGPAPTADSREKPESIADLHRPPVGTRAHGHGHGRTGQGGGDRPASPLRADSEAGLEGRG